MTIGSDIAEALSDIGIGFTILRDSGNISGEYLEYRIIQTQATEPFISDPLEATTAHNTETKPGDVLVFENDVVAIVMDQVAEVFENETISNASILWHANVSGELKRFSGEAWDYSYSYEHESSFYSVKSDCYGLLTEKRTELLQDESAGQIEVTSQMLYLPSSYGAQELDRYEPVSGEYYKIESIEKRQFANIDVCRISEDTRQS